VFEKEKDKNRPPTVTVGRASTAEITDQGSSFNVLREFTSVQGACDAMLETLGTPAENETCNGYGAGKGFLPGLRWHRASASFNLDPDFATSAGGGEGAHGGTRSVTTTNSLLHFFSPPRVRKCAALRLESLPAAPGERDRACGLHRRPLPPSHDERRVRIFVPPRHSDLED
jgi:hypothetical protein